MKHQIRFIIGHKKWIRPPVVVSSGLAHLTSLTQAKKELKQLVKKLHGINGWGRIEKANWEKVWETKY